MGKTYERAPEEVIFRASHLIRKYHADVDLAGVLIDFIYARSDSGAAVVSQGYAALATCRIVSLKDRAKGLADAEIVIDADAYEGMRDEQKDGLLDHELEHIVVKRDDEGCIKLDDLNRPVLKLKKHDWQMGWFTNIAERHGLNSPEVYQAKILWDRDGQAFFPMLIEAGTPDIDREERNVTPVAQSAREFVKVVRKAGATVSIK